jgi:hypothetical protein
MAGLFDFTGVDSAASKPLTKPGTIGVFKIQKVEFKGSKNKGTPTMEVQFENEDSSFTDRFFLKGSDDDKTKKMLGRIQSLFESIYGPDGKLKGQINEEQIKVKLVGKELALKVSGEVSSNGKGYPRLSFGGFCKPKNEVSFLSFTSDEKKAIDEALEAIEASRSGNADSESESNYPTTGGDYSMNDAPPQSEKW